MLMPEQWITDRLPTEADADKNGDVMAKSRPGSGLGVFHHWKWVAPGQPWLPTEERRSQNCTAELTEPPEPDRIAALEQRVAVLEARLSPPSELPSYQQAETEQLRAKAALMLDIASQIEAQS